MTFLIIGIIIGGGIGWIVANAWRNTPTKQPAEHVFLTHKETGEEYRMDQSVRNVAGSGARTIILYRVSEHSMEAWPDHRVEAEFSRQEEAPSPEVQRLLNEARARAAAKVGG